MISYSRLLVVEDIDSQRADILKAAVQCSFRADRITECRSLDAALSEISARHFDFVTLDLNLPATQDALFNTFVGQKLFVEVSARFPSRNGVVWSAYARIDAARLGDRAGWAYWGKSTQRTDDADNGVTFVPWIPGLQAISQSLSFWKANADDARIGLEHSTTRLLSATVLRTPAFLARPAIELGSIGLRRSRGWKGGSELFKLAEGLVRWASVLALAWRLEQGARISLLSSAELQPSWDRIETLCIANISAVGKFARDKQQSLPPLLADAWGLAAHSTVEPPTFLDALPKLRKARNELAHDNVTDVAEVIDGISSELHRLFRWLAWVIDHPAITEAQQRTQDWDVEQVMGTGWPWPGAYLKFAAGTKAEADKVYQPYVDEKGERQLLDLWPLLECRTVPNGRRKEIFAVFGQPDSRGRALELNCMTGAWEHQEISAMRLNALRRVLAN